MRHWWKSPGRRLVVVIIMVLGVGGVLSACQASSSLRLAATGNGVTYCTVLADAPHPVAGSIAAPGHYACDSPGAATITMTVALQQRGPSGAWATVSSRTFVAHGADTTRARTQGTRTHAVTVPCRKGTFRTTVRAIEVAKGRSHTYDERSVTVPDPCNLT